MARSLNYYFFLHLVFISVLYYVARTGRRRNRLTTYIHNRSLALMGTYTRTYIPTTLPKVPYPDTARYPRRTTAKLAPSPCARELSSPRAPTS